MLLANQLISYLSIISTSLLESIFNPITHKFCHVTYYERIKNILRVKDVRNLKLQMHQSQASFWNSILFDCSGERIDDVLYYFQLIHLQNRPTVLWKMLFTIW